MSLGGDLAILRLRPPRGHGGGRPEGSLPMSMPVTLAPRRAMLGENAAAAADVEDALAKQAAALVGDPVKAHRVYLVQRRTPSMSHQREAMASNLAISVRSTLASLCIFDDPVARARRLGGARAICCPGGHYNGRTLSHQPDLIPDLWLKVFGSVFTMSRCLSQRTTN